MKKIFKIFDKDGKELQRAIFEDEKTMNEFESLLKNQCPWGKPERLEKQEDHEKCPDCIEETRQGEIVLLHKLPAQFTVVIEDFVESYKVLRAKEFAKIDELKMEALVESVVEGRTEKLEEYRALRSQIKLRFPKPE